MSTDKPRIARHNRRAKRKKQKVVGLRDMKKKCSRCGRRRALFWQRAIEPQLSRAVRSSRRRPRVDHQHQLCRECYRAMHDARATERRRIIDRRIKPGTGPNGHERRTGQDRRR